MRIKHLLTVNKDLVNEYDPMKNWLNRVLKNETKNYFNKSYRVINVTIQISDQHADDFVYNRITAILIFEAYKMPRFIKRFLNKTL